ncbi:glycerol acyltransferase [Roseococcus sp. SYP-B2431]|uniref:lysophospholipid acyltransferase family protein n=1 Tax=Roseococcus sp. SYP-B2431 TaxID=2496640 RepID=UPI00103ABDF0|nr:lysophospholipid acyltransferase family protein [Roseococcus sp. SYP-B2431]TCH98873.1 glycerol acyltransferase [Roseococcus sp. SYP-B2431]
MLRFFDWAFRRHFAGSFSALRIARWGEPLAPPGRPLVILANHPGWWDGVLVLLVTRHLFPGRPCYVPMDAAALEKYGFMRRLGVFGVEQNSPRGAVRFLRTVAAVLADPRHILWMNAPGRFADPRERPVPLAPGVARLPAAAPEAVILPLAIEYTHWTEKRGETLIAFGPPVAATDEDGIRAAMTATMDRLAADAISRDPARFRVMLEGRRGMGGLYGLWQRRRFAPDHDPRARQG